MTDEARVVDVMKPRNKATPDGSFDIDDLPGIKPRRVRGVFVLGLSLERFFPSENAQLLILACLAVVSALIVATLQERVLYIPGFKYTGWMALVTAGTYSMCALVEQVAAKSLHLVAPMSEYVKLSLLTMGGMYLTNWSLRYLSYSVRVVFKSSKLIPVMLLSVVYLQKRYTVMQYFSVLLLTSGVVVFMLGDALGKASFDFRGLTLILSGSLAEALAANVEEKRLFNMLGCMPSEVVLYSNLIGCAWALIADSLNGDLARAIQHSQHHPETILFYCDSRGGRFCCAECCSGDYQTFRGNSSRSCKELQENLNYDHLFHHLWQTMVLASCVWWILILNVHCCRSVWFNGQIPTFCSFAFWVLHPDLYFLTLHTAGSAKV